MKKFLSISVSFLLAFVITYAGSGINAYSFCCDECHTYGIEAIAGDICCDIHHDEPASEQNTPENDVTCDSLHEQQCSLDRLDIDPQDAPSERSQTQTIIKQLDISFTDLLYLSNKIVKDETITAYITQTQKPPNLSKHVYFSLLETLII